jgi:hypothetical protein
MSIWWKIEGGDDQLLVRVEHHAENFYTLKSKGIKNIDGSEANAVRELMSQERRYTSFKSHAPATGMFPERPEWVENVLRHYAQIHRAKFTWTRNGKSWNVDYRQDA